MQLQENLISAKIKKSKNSDQNLNNFIYLINFYINKCFTVILGYFFEKIIKIN